jgi:hypothetical protein
MEYLVLAAWVAQGAVGLRMTLRWRAQSRLSPAALVHVTVSVTGLALWLVFAVSGDVAWGWLALGLLTVGNGFGDSLLVGRSRQQKGERSTVVADYPAAIRAVLTGRMPGDVTFHAVFAGVVYFGALAVCVVAS